MVISIAAQDLPGADVASEVVQTITASTIVTGIVLIVAGLAFLFFGYKLYKFMIFTAGFYIGGIIAYIVLVNAEPAAGYPNREIVYLASCVAVGLVCGCLLICFVRLGLVAIGALGGFFLAMWLLSWKSNGLIDTNLGRAIFIGAMSFVGGVLVLFIERPIIYFSTSFAGSFSTIYGIDVFAQKGFTDAVRLFLGSENKLDVAQYELTNVVYAYLASILVLAVIGTYLQYRMNRGYSRIHK